jgi:hypothetical protein
MTKTTIDINEEIAAVSTDAIIVFPSSQSPMVPRWLREAIIAGRLIALRKGLGGEPLTASDEEALAYIIPRSFESPLDGNWHEIYSYLVTKIYDKHTGHPIPKDLVKENISEYQHELLDHLKSWIYDQRKKNRTKESRERGLALGKTQRAALHVHEELFDAFKS